MSSGSSEAEVPRGRRGFSRSALIPVILIAGAVGVATVLIATHHSSQALPGNVQSEQVTGFRGETLSPRKMAPGFGNLRNYNGEPVSLASYRGKAVFVTFLYTRCPDVCPLMTSKLHAALERLSPEQRKQLEIVAVSVDPRHDNRVSVGQFVRVHDMTGRMKYLIGNAHELGPVWEGWNVGSEPDSVDPEFVAHSALIYGIGASGRLTTIYPANFRPGEVVHDLPKLLED